MSNTPIPPPLPPPADTPPPILRDRGMDTGENPIPSTKHPIYGNRLISWVFVLAFGYVFGSIAGSQLVLPILRYGVINVLLVSFGMVFFVGILTSILIYTSTATTNDFKERLLFWMPFFIAAAGILWITCYRVEEAINQRKAEKGSFANANDLPQSKKASATIEYWNALLIQTVDSLNKHSKSGKKDSLFEECVRIIKAIPIKDVDPDAVNHAMDFVNILNEISELLRQSDELASNNEEFRMHISSPEAMLESILRGAMGDPMGKLLETIAQQKELQASERIVFQRAKLLKPRLVEFASNEIRLRAKLTDRYGWAFPPSWMQSVTELFAGSQNGPD